MFRRIIPYFQKWRREKMVDEIVRFNHVHHSDTLNVPFKHFSKVNIAIIGGWKEIPKILKKAHDILKEEGAWQK